MFFVDSKGIEVVRLLILPGKDPPPPLGCCSQSEGSLDKIKKSSERMLTSSISTLMVCCSTMITSSYNHQVATRHPFFCYAHIKRGNVPLYMNLYTSTVTPHFLN